MNQSCEPNQIDRTNVLQHPKPSCIRSQPSRVKQASKQSSSRFRSAPFLLPSVRNNIYAGGGARHSCRDRSITAEIANCCQSSHILYILFTVSICCQLFFLSRRLVRSAVPSTVVAHSQSAQSGGQERKRVAAAVAAVERAVRRAVRAAVRTAECSLCGRVGERAARVRWRGRSVARVHLAHRGIAARSAQTRRERVVAGRRAKLLVESAESTRGRCERTRRRSAGHRVGTHAKRRRGRVHRRRESRIRHDGRSRARRTTPQAVDVLGEVVVRTALGAALPVSRAEGNHPAATTAARRAHAMTAGAHVRRHHRGRAVAVRTVAHGVRGSRHRRERAAEASRATLEVGEPA